MTKQHVLNIYLPTIMVLGLIPIPFGLYMWFNLPESDKIIILVLVVLAIFIEQLGAIILPKFLSVSITPASALSMAAIPLYGPAIASVVAWLGALSGAYKNIREHENKTASLVLTRTLFNTSGQSFAIFMGGVSYILIANWFSKESVIINMFSLFVAACVSNFFGLAIVGSAIYLSSGASVKQIWGEMRMSVPADIGVNSIGGGLIAAATIQFDILGTLFFALPLLSAVYAYKFAQKTQSDYVEDLETEVEEQTADIKQKNDALATAYDKEKETNIELERLSKAKDEFVAQITHELRTPLNSILGFVQLQEEGMKEFKDLVPSDIFDIFDESFPSITVSTILDDMDENTGAIKFGGERLKSLIEELLDMAQVAKGNLAINPKPVSAAELVSMIPYEVDGYIEEKKKSGKIRFSINVEKDLPMLYGDHNRLYQILMNLLSNAVKYTDEGDVFVHVYAENGYINFAVKDAGNGISEALLPRLFEKFDRLDRDNIEGLGLGLPISLELARLHNGDILVDSAIGIGTTFTLIVPIANVAKTDKANQLAMQL